MNFAGGKALVVAGILISTTIVSGVAGAEQRSQTESSERNVVTGNQYSSDTDEGGEGNKDVADAPRGDGPGDPPGDQQRQDGEQRRAVEDRPQPNAAPTPQPAGPQSSDPESQTTEPQAAEPQGDAPRGAASSGGDAGPAASASRKVESATIQRQVRRLEARERAGEIRRAATGYGAERRPQELRIAREQIVAEPVSEEKLKKYKRLYEESAEDYGFGDDWYVLAAVGKVESDHGQNLGPSSAGALGPMQFMPSTWESYGVDANGDGKANIMDPDDAIPAAAKYLEAGGAPDDWYEALFTYNHAGWYVEKVLKVAESYRQAAGDGEVGPYYEEDR